MDAAIPAIRTSVGPLEARSEAIRFGMQIEKDAFNLFVIGPNDVRTPHALKTMLAADVRARPMSSLFDIATFALLARYFDVGPETFRTACS